ncbi:MAG: L-rhamnose/proton symporter RhaT [Terriglobia bacterium]
MNAWTGFLLVVFAGIATGTFVAGLKFSAPWRFENIWLVFSVLAFIVMPVWLAVATVPHFLRVVHDSAGIGFLGIVLYGAAWGVGVVLSGVGVDRMGMAIGMSVLIGIDAAVGTFVPMALNMPQIILTRKGAMVTAAVGTLLVGVVLAGIAGRRRDQSLPLGSSSVRKGSFTVGLLICIVSGIFSAMMNFVFAFSHTMIQTAAKYGASPAVGLNAVWAVALLAGFVPNGIYTAYLLTRKRSWGLFRPSQAVAPWWVGLGMAVIWFAGLIAYGRGAAGMGELGAVIGWPLFMAVLILASTVTGFLTAEWKGAGAGPKRWMYTALAALLAASALLGVANQL